MPSTRKYGPKRTQERVLNYFKKSSDDPDNYYYECLISDGCMKPLSGKKISNLVAHAKTHKDFYRKNFESQEVEILNLPEERLKYIQYCAELVTVNGEPFTLLNKSGFLKLNASKVQILTDGGYGIGLAAPECAAVHDHIKYISTEIVNQIKLDVKDKFVSLMVDAATKYQRSILGLSLQFMHEGGIAIRSVGMINITAAHTAKHMADVILERLKLLDIKTTQIIAITTDNAANMSAMIERMNELFGGDMAGDVGISNDGNRIEIVDPNAKDSQAEADSSNHCNIWDEEYLESILHEVVTEMEDQEQCNEELMEVLENRPDFSDFLRDLEEILNSQTTNINNVRCAVHTLQLGVLNALNQEDFKIIIRLCRAVCKELRKPSNINEMKENHIFVKVPRLDCITRWNSIYIMLFDLVSYCENAIRHFSAKKKPMMCFQLFLFKMPVIIELLTALKIPYEATIALQNAAFTLSDFYGCWLTIIRRLNKLVLNENAETSFAQTLITSIQQRQASLLNNQAILCAIYLDKRYEFKLSDDERKIAKIVLEKLFQRVETAKKAMASEELPTKTVEEDSFENECVASGLERAYLNDEPSATEKVSTFSELLAKYDTSIDRINGKKPILDYWNENKYEHPELYELAMIVHSIPPTQATVERFFSLLGYIYNCRRTRLAPETLENILMILLNRTLFDAIQERDLEALQAE